MTPPYLGLCLILPTCNTIDVKFHDDQVHVG